MRALHSAIVLAGIAGALGLGRLGVGDPGAEPAWSRAIVGVPRIIDGDTIDINGQRIRFWGIDAPEIDTPAGQLSAAYLSALLHRLEVACEDTGGRSHGRIVALCRLPDGRDVAAMMVRARRARDWPEFSNGYYSR